MTTAVLPETTMDWTAADLGERFGKMPLWRIRLNPFPATEEDVLNIHAKEGRWCELFDGVLVEKTMGYRESLLAVALAAYLRAFVQPRRLGKVAGADGTIRLFPGMVRIPDVSFISWNSLPGRQLPREQIPTLAPDLAVEVLSPGNTAQEMERKRGEYFGHGVRLLWIVDPLARTITVYTDPATSVILRVGQTLDGGNVLPGFTLALADLFAELDEEAPPA